MYLGKFGYLWTATKTFSCFVPPYNLHLLNRTTAQEHFKPENALKFDRKEQKSLMNSSVPSGDKDKIPLPLSEIRASYPGQSVDHIKPNRYPEYIDYGIIDTLKTDRRKPPPYRTTNQVRHWLFYFAVYNIS